MCAIPTREAPANTTGSYQSRNFYLKLEKMCPKLEKVCPKLEKVCPTLEKMCPKLEKICPKLEKMCPKIVFFLVSPGLLGQKRPRKKPEIAINSN